ncbi:ABC transporter substrate-binding protein [Serratia sp. UGAL515B_01]|uniref:ABC transporter substrate-binding protein n=1 Tax=Serratia sp. UGAL515B_01 TaxID=2986763 RepID=UPI002955B084|nr:ABC transporter substrate-binding protein [Serratia sp. UGAL515B_01]WON78031.1 ABC transporter substrate-binding protein [Serratia sp. UGAL515B_01]
MNRRDLLKAAVATTLIAGINAQASETRSSSSKSSGGKHLGMANIPEETKDLDTLYKEALEEGGELVVYAGGDTIDQQDFNANAFRKRFPKMKLKMNVDFSKFHDARVDIQLANSALAVDVVQLQEIQNFPRWKDDGVLLQYKPKGYSKVYEPFRDPDGYWVSICVNSFANLAHKSVKNPPIEATDYLNPEWKGKIILDYPNDDDATQFLFMKVIEKHGWQWLEKFLEQDPIFARGGQKPVDEVESGNMPLAYGVFGPLERNPEDPAVFSIPKHDPFMAWAQRAAIFKDCKHPAAAKLYLNWWLSEEQQNHWYQWPVRTDIIPKGGYKPIWEYENAYVQDFIDYMMDRGKMERFRSMLTQYIGEAKGPPSAGVLGIYPDTGH